MPRWMELVLLVALAGGFSWLLVGDVWVRLANTHADDGPILSAYLLTQPSLFAGDIVRTYAVANAYASMQNWLPALLLRWLGLAPEYFAIALIYLQIAWPSMGMWYLAHAMKVRRSTGFLAAVMVLALDPLSWNLANYVSLLTVPYAGTLVVGPILLALAATLSHRDRAAVIWLSLAGLVHPTVALYAVAVVGAYHLSASAWQPRDLARKCGPLVIPTLFCVLPALVLRSGIARVSQAELLDAMRRNVHMHPWAAQPLWTREAIAVVAAYLLAAVAIGRNWVTRETRRLWMCSMAVAFVFGALHVVAWWLGATLAIQAIPLRASLLMALVSVPILATTLVHGVTDERLATRFASILTALALGLYGTGLVLFLLPPLICNRGRSTSWWIYLLAVGALIVAVPISVRDQISAPGTVGLYMIALGLAALAAGLLAGSRRASRAPRIATPGAALLLASLLALLAMRKAWSAGRETTEAAPRANYDAQLWARSHTTEDAIFIVRDMPFRTLSRRHVVEPRASRLYVYSAGAATKAFDDGYLAFFGLTSIASRLSTEDLEARQRDAFRDTDAAGFRRLAAIFGGDFVVRARIDPLNLPVAYQNAKLVIYVLDARKLIAQRTR
jgi:hypothetical protein